MALTHDGLIPLIIMYLYELEGQVKGTGQRSKTHQMPSPGILCKSQHMSSYSITPAEDMM
jgi:hypothetical protein